MVKKENIENILKTLPDNPGVYQFLNNKNEIIYVGKAKNLKKRVASYFNKTRHESNKIKVLVSKIKDIKHIIVDSESDALLLENNLIKKIQPRYNVLLKDDKTFPWICIKNERFPRVFSTRKIIQDNSEYYGPYTSAGMVRTLLELIHQLYKLRNCNYNLTKENIKSGKFKICLEYHIGNCKGPCENLQKEEDYNQTIIQIRQIVNGNLQTVLNYLKKMMKKYADEYRFEEAEVVKNKIEILEKFKSKSTIVNQKIHNVDVFSIIDKEKYAAVNYLKVVQGAIIQSHTIELVKKLDESNEDLLTYAIIDIRERFKSDSKEILVPFNINEKIGNTNLLVPQKGDKRHLLELSERNARIYCLEKQKKSELIQVKKNDNRVLEKLKVDLKMKNLPVHIECFDNSNIQGTNPVASCVVFKNGIPSKKDYRHFNIKTVTGPDDYASMEEIVYRRYKRLISEKKSLPQLIIIDGGKGQLNAAIKSLKKLSVENKMAIIGIAKKLEEIYFPGDQYPLYIDKKSESLKLIQRLRNEAHRFGIAFHRDKRSKAMIDSELNHIKGVGEKTVTLLLNNFENIDAIKFAKRENLEKLIGKQKTTIILSFFKQ
jgi:excinuclease ABC subunit C